ncbi:MAG: hypothetical protein JSW59_01165 [Phycisphaerales bacterium]|nr:MAG: hypothetical protein JSW59_01165 [Phycisphaerales bacterium]
MTARDGQIRRNAVALAASLCAVLAVAEAGSTQKVYSSAQKRQTAYDILRKARREPQAARSPEAAGVGPIVAKARLRYTREAGGARISWLAMQRQDTTVVKPSELREIPDDAPPEPVYFTLEIGNRNVHGITYRSTDRTRSVKLRLDTDGDGLTSDEKEYTGTWLSIFRLTRTYQFGPVSTGRSGDSSGTGWCYIHCSNGQWLMLYPARYREGQVELDGRTHKIALVDCDYNGKYNDVFVPPAKNSRDPGCDAFGIDLDGNSKFDFNKVGESELMPLSRLVKIGESYYGVVAAEDGSVVEFRRAKPAFGTLDLGDKDVDVRLWSDAGQQHLIGSKGKWRIPAGRYTAVELKLTERDSAGNEWTFDTSRVRGGAARGVLGDFEIPPGGTTSFQIGPPLQIKTSMEKRGRDALVRFHLEGRAGELYAPGALKNGKDIPEPQFQIVAAGGQTVHSGQFEFR